MSIASATNHLASPRRVPPRHIVSALLLAVGLVANRRHDRALERHLPAGRLTLVRPRSARGRTRRWRRPASRTRT